LYANLLDGRHVEARGAVKVGSSPSKE